MSDHPSSAELEGLLLDRLSPERARFLIVHLLRGCDHCRATLAPSLEALLTPVAQADLPLSPEEDAAYDAAIERAIHAAMKGLGKPGESRKNNEIDSQEALRLIAEGGPEAIPDTPAHLKDLTVIDALLDRSWAMRYENPPEMVRLAQMASTLADSLSSDRYGPRQINEIRLRALTELGNALRVADDLKGAKEAFDRATELFAVSTASERLAARYFDVLASLYGACRFFEMARFALMIAHTTYCKMGDEHLAGRALISLGIYTGYSGEPEEAIRLIRQGLLSVEEERDPELVLSGVQAQARFLLDRGRHREARFALWELKKLYPGTGGHINDLKLLWLEGQIFAATNEYERAERALLQVKEGFAAADLPYKSALAGLELGAVWLRQDRLDEGEKAVLESVGVFIALHIRREVMTAVLMLQKAFETRVATAALVESVADFLRRAEDDPTLRFEPRPLR